MWPVILSLLLVLGAFLVLYYRRRYRFFTERGVETLTPVPFIGSFWRGAVFRKHFLDDFRDGYNTYPNEKYVGFFEGFSPVVLIRDPELVKNITIKDFDHFVDRKNIVFKDHDPMVMNTLLLLKGQKWKDMRGTLSPAFTGSKMRLMLPFMEDIGRQVVQYLHDEVNAEMGQTAPTELYDLFTRYANDVIASCAFGIKVDSLNDRNNEFYSMGRNLTKLKLSKFLVIVVFPRIAKLLNVKMFLPKATKFFRDLACDTMRYREEKQITRPDMIQLLLDAKNGTLKKAASKVDKDSLGFATVEESAINDDGDVQKKWSDDELASQAFQFFIAGFDMVASALTFAAHELAINPHVQARLHAELREHDARGGGRPSYEALQGLRYLDMVISESLRKWGTAVIIERECVKEYVLEPPHSGGKPFTMKPKDYLYILVNAMHMDPQYFPEPHKFDPERFSDERKHEIKPFTYMPFGSGPRNCIGSRFALMELKVMLYQLLLEFELVACEKTSDPIRLGFDVKIVAAGGSWVQFKPRK